MKPANKLDLTLPVIILLLVFWLGCSREPPVTRTIHEAVRRGDIADIKRHINVSGGGMGHGFHDVHAINYRDDSAQMPMHVAAYMGNLDVVKFLAANGAAINVADNSGATPLHLAVSSDHLDVAEFLLNKGANVNARNQSGETPLHESALMGNLAMAKLLVSKGANIQAVDIRDYTPAEDAERMGKHDVKEFLEQPR